MLLLFATVCILLHNRNQIMSKANLRMIYAVRRREFELFITLLTILLIFLKEEQLN
jgi:hypothetical protein